MKWEATVWKEWRSRENKTYSRLLSCSIDVQLWRLLLLFIYLFLFFSFFFHHFLVRNLRTKKNKKAIVNNLVLCVSSMRHEAFVHRLYGMGQAIWHLIILSWWHYDQLLLNLIAAHIVDIDDAWAQHSAYIYSFAHAMVCEAQRPASHCVCIPDRLDRAPWPHSQYI